MISKTIKISEENYKRLLAIATALQHQYGRKVSFDEALHDKLHEKKKNKKRAVDYLLEVKPFSFGKGTEKTSKEIDKIAYG